MIYSDKREQFCDRLLRRIIVFLVILAFAVPLLTPRVFAASVVNISGGNEVKGGETFTVTVTYSNSKLASVNGSMTYDTDKLNYLSGGSSSGNTGYIQLRENGSETISFQIKFQAIGEGSTTLDVSTTEMYDANGNSLDTPSASKKINVIGKADSDKVIEETQAETEAATIAEETTEAGVDEKTDQDDADNSSGGYMFLIISAAALAVIIAVIAAVLIKKRGGKGPKNPKGPNAKAGISGYEGDDTAAGRNANNEYYDPQSNAQKASQQNREAASDTVILDRDELNRNADDWSWENQEDRWPDDDKW